jgi:hypothetical protein
MTAVAAARGPRHIYLSIEGLEADENPGTTYDVMVNVGADRHRETAHEYVVGKLTFFGAKHARQPTDHDGPGALTHTYDITDLVGRLQASGEWDPARLTVTLAPIAPLPPPGQAAEPAVETHPAVKVGRISIYED